jgi:2-oxoglutarate ferredoxin oxidoreductase subunit alpha
MQLTGDRFTSETAALGNDLSTLPNFPAEIRAPQGTLPGVSSFQLQFADHDVLTPGDAPDVLVAMNPAALKANLRDIPRGATIIVNTDEFTKRNLAKVGYATSPVDDDTLASYHVHPVALTSITVEALADFDLSRKDKERAKNMFALGLLSWLYTRPTEAPSASCRASSAPARHPRGQPRRAARPASTTARPPRTSRSPTRSPRPGCRPAPTATSPATSRSSYGLVAAPAARAAARPGLLPDHPGLRHPAHARRAQAVRRDHLQAEDEIAGVGAALGASFGGALGVTTTSGPGLALKAETIGLAVSLELRWWSSTSSAAVPRPACRPRPSRPTCCRRCSGATASRRCRSSPRSPPATASPPRWRPCGSPTTYRTPVLLLSDGYLANGSEPWRIPDVADLPEMGVEFATEPNGTDAKGNPVFHPFQRDPETLARPWASPARRAWSTGSAASRRPTSPARSPTTPTTTTT